MLTRQHLTIQMALLARYGKLINTQLPVYAPPFPTPRHLNRGADDETWPGEAKLAAIRASVEPALEAFKPNFSLPDMPQTSPTAPPLSKRQTIRFGESHKLELEKALKDEEEGGITFESQDSTLQQQQQQPFLRSSSPTTLPMGGSLPPNLNLGPSPLPARSNLGATSPSLPPRDIHSQEGATLSPTYEGHSSNPASASVESGPTLAETGSPIASSSNPGPKSGTLNPRVKSPGTSTNAAMPGSTFGTFLSKDEEAKRERMAQEQQEVVNVAAAARIRRDGTVVRKGDPDWDENLPVYHE